MENMEYKKIPLYGKRGKGKFALVDGDYDWEYFNQYKWYLSPGGYAVASMSFNKKDGYIYLHQLACPPKPGLWVDHIDRDKLNCRSYNLRLVTPAKNALNRPQRPNKFGYKGLMMQPDSSKFYVYFRGIFQGSFDIAAEAGRAWDKAAYPVYGKEGTYNFPEELPL